MMVFSKEKIVFLCVPKTGTTSYQAALAHRASMSITAPPELKHAPVFRYNRFFRPALEKFIGEGLTVMAVVREPISWLGSWYRYRKRPHLDGHPNSTAGVSFDAFVQAYTCGKRPDFANVGSQAKFMEPQKNGTAVTHLFRYEEPEVLIGFLEGRLGVAIDPPRLNTSPAASLELSPDTEEKLRRKSAAEFALWNSVEPDGSYTPPEIGTVG